MQGDLEKLFNILQCGTVYNNNKQMHKNLRWQFFYSVTDTGCLIPIRTRIFIHNFSGNESILTKLLAKIF